MSSALRQYKETTGQPFPTVAKLEMPNDTGFWASATKERSEFVIAVSSGLVATVVEFWRAFDKANDNADRIPATTAELTHNSIVWLLLHELHHYQMGHFAFTGKLCLTEAKAPSSFGVISRTAMSQPPAFKQIADDDLSKIEPCLEMQADHDAIEMLRIFGELPRHYHQHCRAVLPILTR